MARDPYKYFRVEARDLTDQLGRSVIELERTSSGGEIVPRLLRLAHTLKGAARVVRLPAIAEDAHRIEDLLAPFRETQTAVPRGDIDGLLGLLDRITEGIERLDRPVPEATTPAASPAADDDVGPLRADRADLDALVRGITNASAGLAGLSNLAHTALEAQKLTDHIAGQINAREDGRGISAALEPIEQLRGLASDLQRRALTIQHKVELELGALREAAEQLRLVPASAMFAALDRAARDAAQLLGKDVVLVTDGGDVRIDGQTLQPLQNAILQLVRNAVAHGIEVEGDRLAAGKPPRGRVRIGVSRRARRIIFRCEDDGRGIDGEALREAARARGRMPAPVGDRQLASLLLEGGASTSAVISEAAGRGIGMDIVRETLSGLRGEFSVGTERGKGSWFELSVPVSLSSLDCILVEAAGVTASIPLAAVRRTRWLGPTDVHRTQDGTVIIEDGRSLPLTPLGSLLTRNSVSVAGMRRQAVIVQSGGALAAIGVDRIAGNTTLVYRPLPDLAPASDVIEGASLSAGGTPVVLLNAEAVVTAAAQPRHAIPASPDRQRPLLIVDDSLTTRMLEQSILESAGYEVDMAVSAEEGLERLRTRDYALILVDVEMPGMDGFGFVTELRRDPRTRQIPAILITSRNADDDKRRGAEVGAQGYVVKSEFDQAALLGRIRQLLA